LTGYCTARFASKLDNKIVVLRHYEHEAQAEYLGVLEGLLLRLAFWPPAL
jgi:hypothetical protein